MSKDVNIGFVGAGLVPTEAVENIVGDFLESTAEDAQLRFVFALSETTYTDTVGDLLALAGENQDIIDVVVYKDAALKGAGLQKHLSIAREVHNLQDPNMGVLGYLTSNDQDNYLFVMFDETVSLDGLIDDALSNGVRVMDLTDGGVELEGDTSDTTSPIVRVDEDGEATVVLHPDEDPSVDAWENEGGTAFEDTDRLPPALDYDRLTDREYLETLPRADLKKMAHDLEVTEIPRSTVALIDLIVAAAWRDIDADAQAGFDEAEEQLAEDVAGGLIEVGNDLDEGAALLAAAIAAEANKASEVEPVEELETTDVAPEPVIKEVKVTEQVEDGVKYMRRTYGARTQEDIVKEIQELVSELVSLRKEEGESYINFTINNFNLS